MFGKGILSLGLKGLTVKIPVAPKVLCEYRNKFGEGSDTGFLYAGCSFAVEYPVHKVILILKVIVEAFSVHITFLTYVGDRDLSERLFLHKSFQSFCEMLFGDS